MKNNYFKLLIVCLIPLFFLISGCNNNNNLNENENSNFDNIENRDEILISKMSEKERYIAFEAEMTCNLLENSSFVYNVEKMQMIASKYELNMDDYQDLKKKYSVDYNTFKQEIIDEMNKMCPETTKKMIEITTQNTNREPSSSQNLPNVRINDDVENVVVRIN